MSSEIKKIKLSMEKLGEKYKKAIKNQKEKKQREIEIELDYFNSVLDVLEEEKLTNKNPLT